jgi:quercetin dioxygenase-like cupin family protein
LEVVRMANAEVKSFDNPDEVRPTADMGRVEIVRLATGTVGRVVFQPGWRWSEHVKPIAGTDSCQAPHIGYVVSGSLGFRMDDGTEGVVTAGDAFVLPPGHDAWVVGDEPTVQVDFNGMQDYAKGG